jgi:signal transduction histidine kinase
VGIYRVAQEALNNIAKHADASHVTIKLNCSSDSGLDLTIEDDGRGFDPEVVPSGRLGLGIMQERTNEVGASLDIESQKGNGTVVRLHWVQNQFEEVNHG